MSARLAVASGLAAGILLAAAGARAAAIEIPTNDYEREMILRRLVVHHGGTFTLPVSKGKIEVPSSDYVLIGEEARKFYAAENGAVPVENVEAAIIDHVSESTIFYVANTSGYVSLADWSEIKPAAILEKLQADAAAQNDRRSAREPSITVLGWRSEPSLDRRLPAVSYALDLKIGAAHSLSATALLFGRSGYEKFVWLGTNATSDPQVPLAIAVNSFTFAPDARYADHRPGDPAARQGIAALIAGTVVQANGMSSEGWIFAMVAVLVLGGAGYWWWRGMAAAKPA